TGVQTCALPISSFAPRSDRADAELAARVDIDIIEPHLSQPGEHFLDRVVLAVAEAAGGDQQIGPDELVLEDLPQPGVIVDGRPGAEGPAAGVLHPGG